MSTNPYLSVTTLADVSSLLDTNKMMVLVDPGDGQGSSTTVGSISLPELRDNYLLLTVNQQIAELQTRPGNGAFATPITMSFTGVVTGSVLFDGSTNVSAALTMPSNSIPITAVTDLASTIASLESEIGPATSFTASYYSSLNAAQTTVLGYWNPSTTGLGSGEDQYGTILQLSSDGALAPSGSNYVNQLMMGSNGALVWRQNVNNTAWNIVSLWHSGNFTPSNYLPATTQLTTGGGLSGGGALSGGLSLSLASQAAGTLLGNPTAGVATPTAITLGSGMALSVAGVLSATGSSPPFAMANGATLASWAGGAYIASGGQGGSLIISSTNAVANPLNLVNSTGTTVWYCDPNGNVVKSGTLASGGLISASPTNGDAFKAINNAGANVLGIGMGVSGPTDVTAFIINRTTTGGISFYVNAGNAGTIAANGTLGWNFGVTATSLSVTGVSSNYTGAVSSQQVTRAIGWNNAVPRWKEVINADASYSLYSYDTSGATPTVVLSLASTVAGGANTVSVNGAFNAASYGGAGVSQAASGSTVVQRNPSGYIFANYLNTTANDIGAGAISHVAVQTNTDGFHRWMTPANFFKTAVPFLYANGGIQSTALTTATNGQGAYLGWNRNANGAAGGMNGETDFINHYGGGNGGFAFFNTNASTYTQLVSIDSAGSILAAGLVTGSRFYTGWDSGVTGAVSCNNWFRASGQTGVFFNDYGGGVYMTDATYVRAYNGKAMAAADFVVTSDEREKAGIRPFEFKGRLVPKSFTMRKDGSLDFGFIAQQVQELYPEAVGYIEESDRFQLSYGKLTAVLSYQVNRVEDDVSALKAQLAAANDAIAVLREQVDGLLKAA